MTNNLVRWAKTHWEISALVVIAIAAATFWKPEALQGLEGLVVMIAIGVAILFGYFLPTYVAYQRNHHNRKAIAVLNWLAGWTFVGWVIALVWAYTATGGSNEALSLRQ